jgi:hypothetical protein
MIISMACVVPLHPFSPEGPSDFAIDDKFQRLKTLGMLPAISTAIVLTKLSLPKKQN